MIESTGCRGDTLFSTLPTDSRSLMVSPVHLAPPATELEPASDSDVSSNPASSTSSPEVAPVSKDRTMSASSKVADLTIDTSAGAGATNSSQAGADPPPASPISKKSSENGVEKPSTLAASTPTPLEDVVSPEMIILPSPDLVPELTTRKSEMEKLSLDVSPVLSAAAVKGKLMSPRSAPPRKGLPPTPERAESVPTTAFIGQVSTSSYERPPLGRPSRNGHLRGQTEFVAPGARAGKKYVSKTPDVQTHHRRSGTTEVSSPYSSVPSTPELAERPPGITDAAWAKREKRRKEKEARARFAAERQRKLAQKRSSRDKQAADEKRRRELEERDRKRRQEILGSVNADEIEARNLKRQIRRLRDKEQENAENRKEFEDRWARQIAAAEAHEAERLKQEREKERQAVAEQTAENERMLQETRAKLKNLGLKLDEASGEDELASMSSAEFSPDARSPKPEPAAKKELDAQQLPSPDTDALRAAALAAEKAEKEKQEQERLAAERAEKERKEREAAAEKARLQKEAEEEAERKKQEEEKLRKEKLEREAQEKLEQEQREREVWEEKLRKEQLEREAGEHREREKQAELEREKVAREAQEKAEREKQEQLEKERVEREKQEELDRLAKEEAEKERQRLEEEAKRKKQEEEQQKLKEEREAELKALDEEEARKKRAHEAWLKTREGRAHAHRERVQREHNARMSMVLDRKRLAGVEVAKQADEYRLKQQAQHAQFMKDSMVGTTFTKFARTSFTLRRQHAADVRIQKVEGSEYPYVLAWGKTEKQRIDITPDMKVTTEYPEGVKVPTLARNNPSRYLCINYEKGKTLQLLADAKTDRDRWLEGLNRAVTKVRDEREAALKKRHADRFKRSKTWNGRAPKVTKISEDSTNSVSNTAN